MDIAEKTLQLKQDFDDVYEAGKQVGKNDRDHEFWEQLQNNGKPMVYIWLFAYARFTDETYNPIYDIICKEDSTNAGQNVFYNSLITDTKVAIYANPLNINGMFYWARKLETIRKLVVYETTTYTSCFGDCQSLKNITFEGVIGQTINTLGNSPLLTTQTIVNIIEHLSDSASSKSITLSTNAVNNMTFPYVSVESGITYNSWDELIATKPNWGFSLA